MSDFQQTLYKRWLLPSIVAIGAVCLLLVTLTLTFGSLNRGINFALGKRVVSQTTVTRVAQVRAGEKQAFKIELTNLSFSDLKIIGADVSCRCAVVRGLPLSLPARSSTILDMTMKPPNTAVGKPYEATIVAYFSVPHDPLVLTLVADEVTPSQEPVEENDVRTSSNEGV